MNAVTNECVHVGMAQLRVVELHTKDYDSLVTRTIDYYLLKSEGSTREQEGFCQGHWKCIPDMAPFLAHLPATPCCIPIPGTFAPLWNANGSSSPVTALGSDAAPATAPAAIESR